MGRRRALRVLGPCPSDDRYVRSRVPWGASRPRRHPPRAVRLRRQQGPGEGSPSRKCLPLRPRLSSRGGDDGYRKDRREAAHHRPVRLRAQRRGFRLCKIDAAGLRQGANRNAGLIGAFRTNLARRTAEHRGTATAESPRQSGSWYSSLRPRKSSYWTLWAGLGDPPHPRTASGSTESSSLRAWSSSRTMRFGTLPYPEFGSASPKTNRFGTV